MEGVCWNSTMYCLLQMRHNFCTELCTDGVDHHEFPRLRSIAKKKKEKAAISSVSILYFCHYANPNSCRVCNMFVLY